MILKKKDISFATKSSFLEKLYLVNVVKYIIFTTV